MTGWLSDEASIAAALPARRRRAAGARFGHAQAIVRRGEAVQLQFRVRIFGRNRNRSARCCGARGDYDFGIMEECR